MARGYSPGLFFLNLIVFIKDMRIEADYLIMGSGIAGLFFALKAAKRGSVAVVTKRERRESNTQYAQGGIAAVMDPADSFESHVRDTLAAGAGLCDLTHRRDHFWVCVTEDHWSPGADVVDVLVAVDVADASSLRGLDEGRNASHRLEGSHGAIYAAGNGPLCALELSARFTAL